jgi:hypothetical protein
MFDGSVVRLHTVDPFMYSVYIRNILSFKICISIHVFINYFRLFSYICTHTYDICLSSVLINRISAVYPLFISLNFLLSEPG